MPEKTCSPKDKARAARLLMATARLIHDTLKELETIEHGQNLYDLRRAEDECVKAAVTMPDVKVAIFASDEATAEGGGK